MDSLPKTIEFITHQNYYLLAQLLFISTFLLFIIYYYYYLLTHQNLRSHESYSLGIHHPVSLLSKKLVSKCSKRNHSMMQAWPVLITLKIF